MSRTSIWTAPRELVWRLVAPPGRPPQDALPPPDPADGPDLSASAIVVMVLLAIVVMAAMVWLVLRLRRSGRR